MKTYAITCALFLCHFSGSVFGQTDTDCEELYSEQRLREHHEKYIHNDDSGANRDTLHVMFESSDAKPIASLKEWGERHGFKASVKRGQSTIDLNYKEPVSWIILTKHVEGGAFENYFEQLQMVLAEKKRLGIGHCGSIGFK